MDEGDLDFSNPEVFSRSGIGSDVPSSCSMDGFFNEILTETPQHHACTHTHTCNPPGPDLSHTHTCLHVHTKILSAPSANDETADSRENLPAPKKQKPCGNREAVRKYREKKKAHAASLEDEVIHLREVNQQLMRKLQNQAALEAEVSRLRCLLVDIRGRIEGEIGSFPYQRPTKGNRGVGTDDTQGNIIDGGQFMNKCDFRCDDPMYCLPAGVQMRKGNETAVANGQGLRTCDITNVQCIGSIHPGSSMHPVRTTMDLRPAGGLSNCDNK